METTTDCPGQQKEGVGTPSRLGAKRWVHGEVRYWVTCHAEDPSFSFVGDPLKNLGDEGKLRHLLEAWQEVVLGKRPPPQWDRGSAVVYCDVPGSDASDSSVKWHAIPADARAPKQTLATCWEVARDVVSGTPILRELAQPFYSLRVDGTGNDASRDAFPRIVRILRQFCDRLSVVMLPGDVAGSWTLLLTPLLGSEFPHGAPQLGAREIARQVCGVDAADFSNSDKRRCFLTEVQGLRLERQFRERLGLPDAGEAILARGGDGAAFSVNTVPNPTLDFRRTLLSGPQAGASLRATPNVLVRILRASICASDRRVLRGEKQNDLSRGLVLGHEGGGCVVDPGPWADELGQGTLVAILPHVTCGECGACGTGRTNLCPGLNHLGFHDHGCFSDLGLFARQSLFAIPQPFPVDALPLVEPLACVIRAIGRVEERLVAAPSSQTLMATFGAGPMGMLAALYVARRFPTRKVAAVDPSEMRRKAVSRLLAEAGIEITLLDRPTSAAVIFVASSRVDAYKDAVANTGDGGCVLAFSGINTSELANSSDPARDEFARNCELVHRREHFDRFETADGGRATMLGSSGYTQVEVQGAIDELREHYDRVYRFIQNLTISGLGSLAGTLAHEGEKKSLQGESLICELLAERGTTIHSDEVQKVLVRLDVEGARV